MRQNSHHLISRLRWDTLFDNKAQGVALQERLSDWTGFQMQQELSAVFDKFCPPEQTWRIQSLELDLGTIDFDHLETELTIKLRQQLNEKLISLMLYSHQYGSDIEILDEKRSHIQLIRYFLWHGLLPWNYQANDGSVNQILTVQLQNNQEELLFMLKESGLNALQVRRRMAWQFNEPNMIRIITAIEPNVAGQIILFSNELTKIQQMERVVQVSSTTDFKKNVWFWVLNYLLTERGTVFNRIQFMKSNIIQMAAHYNMKYDQLFELIELSVSKLSSSLSLQPDFIITLQLLSKENRAYKKKKVSPAEEVEDHWLALETLFLDQTLRRNAGNVVRFNDLVAVLSNQDRVRFRTLMVAFENRAEFWLILINDLSDHSLKMMFSTLNDNRSVILTESIFFLNRLLGSVMQASERNALWHTGLIFLLAHKNESFNETAFVHVLVAVLAQKKQRSTMVLLDQLLVAEIPSSIKILRYTTIYRTLVSVFKMEISKMPGPQFKKHLHQLMEQFHLQVRGGGKNRKRFETLKNILENYFIFQPKVFMEALKTTPYQQSLELFLPEAVSGKKHTFINLADGIHRSINQKKTGRKELQKTKEWLDEMLLQPEQFLDFVKKEVIAEPQLLWLYQQINFERLLKMIGSQHQAPQPILSVLGQFYYVLGLVSLSGISSGEMQLLLFKKVIRAWTSGNWKLIAAENIWNEMIWEVCSKKGVSKTDFLRGMNVQNRMLPPVLQLTLESLQTQDRLAAPSDQGSGSKKTLPKVGLPVIGKNDLIKEPIPVKNAGLVLLNNYISLLLTRLELVQGGDFCNTESQVTAVHYLQYLVTGQSHTEEFFLPLNKVLCGVALSQPVPEGIHMSKVQQELIEGLIMAALSHWPSIGKSSVDGFRGNWLVRDGLLIEKEDRWELIVEKRAYDLLIQKSPFSFSVIRYSWMDKPLHVIWPY